jgi:hypothetical protein
MEGLIPDIPVSEKRVRTAVISGILLVADLTLLVISNAVHAPFSKRTDT